MSMSSLRSLAVSKPLAFLSLLLVLAGVSTCGDSSGASEITVVVDVAGLTPDITSLYVTTTLNGTPAQQGQTINTTLTPFAVALPLQTSGPLIINVVARSAESCVVATGTVTVTLQPAPPTRYEVMLNLMPLPNGAAKSCTLTVQVDGTGTVTSSPAGIQCAGTGTQPQTECTYDFPIGTSITLTTMPGPKTYGVTYAGLCSGSGPCTINFSAPGTVRVGIPARICSTGNWCWYNPLPQGNSLYGVWGSATNDVWAVVDGALASA